MLILRLFSGLNVLEPFLGGAGSPEGGLGSNLQHYSLELVISLSKDPNIDPKIL